MKPMAWCNGAQMYMLNHAAMEGILTAFVPEILPILDDNKTTPTTASNTNCHEVMTNIKTLIRDTLVNKLLQRGDELVDWSVEMVLYRHVQYYATTRPFGYQPPEVVFDAFYSSTEERRQEIYEPITEWIGPKHVNG